jgi:DNA-binding MarR family transcriptional regulator
MHEDRLANLLGAAALTISDLMLGAATAAEQLSASAAAALVVSSTAPGLSVTDLGRRVGLSQPAAARMVDALSGRGLVERRSTPTRSVAVHLTTSGTSAVRQLQRARAEALSAVVGGLVPAQRETLAALLDTLLAAVYGQLPQSARLCRLCDRATCVADGRTCPVGQAERRAELREAEADDG